jgi:tetratricopeptide (TPR) repeat protein
MIPAVLLLQLATSAAPRPTTRCATLSDSVVATAAMPSRATGFARSMNRECRNDFAALFRAGRALSHSASFKGTQRNYSLRDQAQRLLDRATTLHPRDAMAWLEYGILLRKIGGIQIDAQRAIQRALDLAEQYPDSTDPTLLATLDLQRARYFQDLVDRQRWLKSPAGLGVTTPSCSGIGAFCENYTRPAQFNQTLKEAPHLDDGLGQRREDLLRLYNRVITYDPRNQEAAERLARELALAGEWEQLGAFAAKAQGRGVEPGLFGVVAALAAERQGHAAYADSLFDDAIPQLPDSLARWFTHLPAGLDSFPDFWNRARPLWTTPYNELEVDYRTRVAYALLVLHDREAEVAGPETPVGDALIRYGWPAMVTQFERDPTKILSATQQAAAQAFMDCTGADAGGDPGSCEPGPGVGNQADVSGGRWMFWTYAMDRPSMIFEQHPGMRVPRYLRDAPAEEYAVELRKKSPLTFTSKLAPKSYRLPVQVARFKGEIPGATTLAIYGLVQAQQMALPPGDSITAGLFVFHDTAGFPIAAQQKSRYVPGEGLALSYRVPLSAGRYSYDVEAYAAGTSAATARDTITLPTWRADTLSMSDLLVAHQLSPRTDAPSLTWRDLLLQPSRTLTVTPGSNLWIVWETYGLKPTDKGMGRYHVAVTVQDVTAKPLLVRLLGRVGGSRVPAQGVTLEWDSDRPVAADGRALEYVSIELPAEAAGDYLLVVTLKDPQGRTTQTTRPISVLSPATPK